MEMTSVTFNSNEASCGSSSQNDNNGKPLATGDFSGERRPNGDSEASFRGLAASQRIVNCTLLNMLNTFTAGEAAGGFYAIGELHLRLGNMVGSNLR